MKMVVVGIFKIIDNDIEILDKMFGFDMVVEEVQCVINVVYIEVYFFFLFKFNFIGQRYDFFYIKGFKEILVIC